MSSSPVKNATEISSASVQKWGLGAALVAAVGLFIGSFYELSKFAGSSDSWNQVKPQVAKVLVMTLIGTILLMIAALIYFIQDPQKTIYFTLVVSCIAIGMSYAALAVAAISR